MAVLTKWDYMQAIWDNFSASDSKDSESDSGEWFTTKEIRNILDCSHQKFPIASCHQMLEKLHRRGWLKKRKETYRWGIRAKWKGTKQMSDFYSSYGSFINSPFGKNPVLGADVSKG